MTSKTTTKTIPVKQVIAFLRVYGEDAYAGDDARLANDLLWHAQHDRLYFLKDQDGLAGICAWRVLRTIDPVKRGVWVDDDPEGAVIYVAFAAVHPLYKHKKLIEWWLNRICQEFPKVRDVYFHRDNKNRSRLIRLPVQRGGVHV